MKFTMTIEKPGLTGADIARQLRRIAMVVEARTHLGMHDVRGTLKDPNFPGIKGSYRTKEEA